MNDEQKNLLISNNFDVKGTLSRFMNKDELYEKFLYKFLDDVNYNSLVKALEEKDYESAYVSAHTLKGVAGNLGINGIFDITVEFLTKFKEKDYTGLDELLECLTNSYHTAVKTINSLK